jgi:hypothetical protein
MRALLIDAEGRTITEVEIGKGLDAMCAALGCGEVEIGAYLSFAPGFDAVSVFDAVFVEAAMLEDREPSPRHWFQIDADREPPSSYPISGKGLVVGTNREGEDCSARIGVAELASRVTFTERKFRDLEAPTDKPGVAVVELETLIIDGTRDAR